MNRAAANLAAQLDAVGGAGAYECLDGVTYLDREIALGIGEILCVDNAVLTTAKIDEDGVLLDVDDLA